MSGDGKLQGLEQVLYAMLVSPDQSLSAYARLTGYPIDRFFADANLAGVTLSYREYEELGLASLRVDLTGANIVRTDDEQRIAEQFELTAMELFSSNSFAQTHVIVAKLLQGFPFSRKTAEIFATAARENGQVGWIIADPDLMRLIDLFVTSPEVMADRNLATHLRSLLEEARSRRL